MTKKLMLSAVASVLLIVGCGGGGGGGDDSTPVDPMTEKDTILILYHYPADICMSDALKNELIATTPDASDFLIRVESNDVTCATYGKTNTITDTEACSTIDMAGLDSSLSQYDTSCVIGANVTTTTSLNKLQLSEDMSLAAEFSVDTFN